MEEEHTEKTNGGDNDKYYENKIIKYINTELLNYKLNKELAIKQEIRKVNKI